MSTSESPQVAAIRARYQTSLMEKSQLIDNHAKAVNKANSEAAMQAATHELREDLHKLAGSSGMYGYTDISEVCRKAMRVVDNNVTDELESCLAELQDLIKVHA